MEEKTLWGLPKSEYNALATPHSKADIFLWVIGGMVYNGIIGNLFSLSTALLIIPGIFIASYASMLTFWVEIQKRRILPQTNNVFVLLGFTIWFVIDLAYPVILSILFINLVNLF